MRNLYPHNRQYLGGLIKKKEFNQIIERSSKLTALVYSENRKADVEGISNGLVITLLVTTCMLFAYFFLLFYGIRNQNKRLKIAGFFLLALSLFVTAIIGIRNYFQKPGRYTPFTAAVRKTLNA